MPRSNSYDIEYVGGPEDGKTTVLVVKVAGALPDQYLEVYNDDLTTLHKYRRTKRRTKEGLLVYEYAGATRIVKHC
jgi:hypothetical protein